MSREVYESFWKALLSKQVVTGELINKTRDGRLLTIESSTNPILNEHGESIGFLAIQHDVTERKQAAAELQLSQQRLSLHVEQTPLAVIEYDPTGRVRQWNPAAVAMFGYSREEAIGQDWIFIVPAALHGEVAKVWTAIVSQRGGNRSTNENITKDGRTIHCEWFNTPLVDPDGRTIGVASLIQDVSERKQAEAQVAEQLDELSHWHAAMLGREDRVIEVKKEVNALRARLGEPPSYPSAGEGRDA